VINELRGVFETRGHWNAHAELALSTNVAGARVQLDGIELGVMSSTSARLTGLSARPSRQITLIHPEYGTRTEIVGLQPGRIEHISIVFSRPRDETASTIKSVVFWSGAASSLAGAALIVTAVAQDEDTALYCVGEDAAACPNGAMFHTAANDPDLAPFEVREPGASIAAIGLGLFAAGATWLVGTVLFGADDELPWIQIAAGAAVGAAVFGASVALSP
jgi:hypothetical protein